jgi:hypothetical protein
LPLVHRYRTETDLTYYPAGETVPTHPGLSGDWAELAHRVDGRGRRRTVRTVYKIRTFEALCDQLKCKGVWVVGAMEFRNPEEDLPRDFDTRRTEHYQALRKPLDPSAFIDAMQTEMRAELGALKTRCRCPGWRSGRGRATRARSSSALWKRCPSRRIWAG